MLVNYEKHRCSDNLKVLRQASRNYNKSVKNAMKQYEKAFNKKLRSPTCTSNNPNEFWKSLCSGDQKNVSNKINLDVLTEFFES